MLKLTLSCFGGVFCVLHAPVYICIVVCVDRRSYCWLKRLLQ